MKLLKRLSDVEDVAMNIILWVLFFTVALQFFTRYIFNSSFGWTEEVARVFLIVLTYVGAVVAARKKTHIRVDLVLMMLSKKYRYWANTIIDLISCILFGFLCWTAVRFAQTTRLEMSSIEVPKSILFWICAASLGLMALHYAIDLFSLGESTDGDD